MAPQEMALTSGLARRLVRRSLGEGGIIAALRPSPRADDANDANTTSTAAVSIPMRLNQLLRSLGRMPLFTGITVLTLALGIGANTAIFSVVEGVLLKPLPYPRSGELVTLDHVAPGVNLPHIGAAPFQYFSYREDGRVFQDVGLWNTGTVSVTGLAEPEEVATLFVTDAILPLLGVQPMFGRVFTRA